MLDGGPPYIDLKYGLNNSWYVMYDNEEITQKAYLHLQSSDATFNNRPVCARIKAGGPPTELPPIDRIATLAPDHLESTLTSSSSTPFTAPLLDIGTLLHNYGYVAVATYSPPLIHVHEGDMLDDAQRNRGGRRNGGANGSNQEYRKRSSDYWQTSNIPTLSVSTGDLTQANNSSVERPRYNSFRKPLATVTPLDEPVATADLLSAQKTARWDGESENGSDNINERKHRLPGILWGPDDDGRTLDGPATLNRLAFERRIKEGSKGKGSVLIWASGNGGKVQLRRIYKQHIVIHTAKPIHLKAGDWITNGVGRNVHSFGYGLMDAGAMVHLARNWTTVGEQHRCKQFYPSRFKTIPNGNRLQLQLYTDGCAGTDDHVVFLEHVQAIITLKAPKRGDIQIHLINPSGTRSTLLTKRARDTSRAGFIEFRAFMSTHNWGEGAAGLWTLDVDNDGWDAAELVKWDLVMFGTSEETSETGGRPSLVMERSIGF